MRCKMQEIKARDGGGTSMNWTEKGICYVAGDALREEVAYWRMNALKGLLGLSDKSGRDLTTDFIFSDSILTNEALHQKAMDYTRMIAKTVIRSLILKLLPYLNPSKRKSPILLTQILTKIL